jgi:hypothetical protein
MHFNLVWNNLGDLMKYLVWNAFLELGHLDVSSKQYFVPGMAAPRGCPMSTISGQQQQQRQWW